MSFFLPFLPFFFFFLAGHTLSHSSMYTMEGWYPLAAFITMATILSVSGFPAAYLPKVATGLKSNTTERVSLAIARTIRVFPVPSGP